MANAIDIFLYSASEEQKTNIHINLLHKKLCKFKNSVDFKQNVSD